MSLTGIAALIAAVSFAVLACAGVYLAVRFTRVLGDAATLVRDTRSDQQALFARANTAVDRANAQLDLTEAATASVGELGTAMTELAGQASALAGVGRTVAGAVVGGPLGRAAAVAYGVRHAVGVRTRHAAAAAAGRAGRRRPGTARRPPATPAAPAAAPPGRGGAMIRRGFWLRSGRRAASWATGGSPRSAASCRQRCHRRTRDRARAAAGGQDRPRGASRGAPAAQRPRPGAAWCAGQFGLPATRGCSAGTSGRAWTCIWFGIGPREALRLAQAPSRGAHQRRRPSSRPLAQPPPTMNV